MVHRACALALRGGRNESDDRERDEEQEYAGRIPPANRLDVSNDVIHHRCRNHQEEDHDQIAKPAQHMRGVGWALGSGGSSPSG